MEGRSFTVMTMVVSSSISSAFSCCCLRRKHSTATHSMPALSSFSTVYPHASRQSGTIGCVGSIAKVWMGAMPGADWTTGLCVVDSKLFVRFGVRIPGVEVSISVFFYGHFRRLPEWDSEILWLGSYGMQRSKSRLFSSRNLVLFVRYPQEGRWKKEAAGQEQWPHRVSGAENDRCAMVEGSAVSVNALKHLTTEAEGLYVPLIVYGKESEATTFNRILEAF